MKAVRFFAGIVALVLIVVGGAVAILLGPDDTWGGDPGALPDSAPIIATAPKLLNVAGVNLVVKATVAQGEVFAGAAHPVHVQDYVRDVTRTEITQLSADGIGGSQRLTGERAYPTAPPTEVDVWDQQTQGSEVRLEVPLTQDAPVQVVVLPATAKGATPQVGVGYQLPGAFVAAVAAAIVGLLLVLGTVLWGRRAKRAKQARAAEPTAEPADRETATLSRRATRVALVGTVAVFAAGCTVPQQVERGDSPGVVPLEQADAQAMLDDYDVRNNAAIKKSHTGDGSLWSQADSGLLLAVDDHAARRNKAERPKGKPRGFTSTAGSVYETEQSAYPLWSVVQTTSSVAEDDETELGVFVKVRATSPWTQASATPLRQPAPGPVPVEAAMPDGSDLERATEVAALVETYVEKGSAKGLEVDPALAADRADLTKKEKGVERVTHSVGPWGGSTDDPTAAGGPVQALRVDGGLLVLTQHEWEQREYLKNGFHWTPSPKYVEVYGKVGDETANDEHYALTTAVLVPDSGDAEMIGSQVSRVVDFPR